MVNKATITRNLNELNSRYNRKYRNSRDPLYYAKLSVLELCGWVESTMDDIVVKCARTRMKNSRNINYVQKEIVDRTSGFTYDYHFRGMLMRIIGLVNLERLEKTLDQRKFIALKASLKLLSDARNQAAHTHLDKATATYTSPSLIMRYFQDVYDGLKDIEQCIRRLQI